MTKKHCYWQMTKSKVMGWGVAVLVKCLLRKHEDLPEFVFPGPVHVNTGMMAHACIPFMGQTQIGGS